MLYPAELRGRSIGLYLKKAKSVTYWFASNASWDAVAGLPVGEQDFQCFAPSLPPASGADVLLTIRCSGLSQCPIKRVPRRPVSCLRIGQGHIADLVVPLKRKTDARGRLRFVHPRSEQRMEAPDT